eukprot:45311_1
MSLKHNEQITAQTILKQHQENMLSGSYLRNIPQNTSQIVEIFGGIENVLNICLGGNLTVLNNNKLQTLNQIIQTQSQYKQYKHANKNIQTQKIVNNIHIKKEDATEFEYTFDENNTLLHSICTQTKAHKIKKWVDNKIVLALVIITILISITLGVVLLWDSVVSNVYEMTCLSLFWVPWLILKHLLFNKRAFKLCIKTFDYWIKVGYGIIYGIAIVFHQTPPVNGFTLVHIRKCINIIFTVLVISYISSFDAVNTSKKKKLSISVSVALLCSFLAMYCQLFDPEEFDYKIRIQVSESTHIISIQSIMASSMRIIALFIWKQAINTYCRKGKAVLLSTAVKIVWIDSNSNKETEKQCEEKDYEMRSTDICLEEENNEINVVNASKRKQKEE